MLPKYGLVDSTRLRLAGFLTMFSSTFEASDILIALNRDNLENFVVLAGIQTRPDKSEAGLLTTRLSQLPSNVHAYVPQPYNLFLQVVTLSLYTYFVAALMGRQLVPPADGSTSKYEPDVYFPLFTALQ
ncbi:jg26283, partial [Pararge aegeria aegeria]